MLAIRHMDGHLSTIAPTLAFVTARNLSASCPLQKFVEPVFDTGNVTVGAVRVDAVKVVVDGDVADIVLRESVVDIQSRQSGVSPKP